MYKYINRKKYASCYIMYQLVTFLKIILDNRQSQKDPIFKTVDGKTQLST